MQLESLASFPSLAGGARAPARMLPRMEPLDEDAALMLRYQAGDARAFDALYARHKGALYRYLLRHVRNAASATDLFQEVWMRVIASRQRYMPSAKFSTFLFHIAHNLAIDHHRRARATPIESGADSGARFSALTAPDYERPDRIAEYDERLASFESALAALPAEQREAFLLHEESGLDIAQIAAVTSVGAETAKSRLRYAIAKLKKSLSEPAAAVLSAV
jgi:RNA polymerase sigma-70 factor (ECF subfamily)